MKKFIIIVIFAMLIVGGAYLYNKNENFKNVSNIIINKDLSTSDVTLDIKQSLTDISIMVSPKVDVKDITIEYEVYSSSKTVIKSGKLIKYNLYRGQTYEYELGLSFTQLLKVDSVGYRMINGTKK